MAEKSNDISNAIYIGDGFWFTKNSKNQIVINFNVYNDDETIDIRSEVVKHMTQDDVDWMVDIKKERDDPHSFCTTDWEFTSEIAYADLYTDYEYVTFEDGRKGINVTIDDKTKEKKFYWFDEKLWVYVSDDGDKLYESLIYSGVDPVRGFIIGFVHWYDLIKNWYEDLVDEHYREYIDDTTSFLKLMCVKY